MAKILTVSRKSHHPIETPFVGLLPTSPGQGYEGQIKSCEMYSIIRHKTKIDRRFINIVANSSIPIDVKDISL